MNRIKHFSKKISTVIAGFLLCTLSPNMQAQICPSSLEGFCNASFLAVNADFDSGTGVGDCPVSITFNDGTNSVTVPRNSAFCNTSAGAEEAYLLMPNSSAFNCNATEFTVDIGTEVCNYTAAAGFNSALLPVELTKFTAYLNQATILLEWETAMELNNDFFTVEKSTDGRNFSSIGKLDGAEASIERRQYMFIDNKPSEGRNYYRLKQTDKDGKFEYFEVVVVEYHNTGEVTIFPNPVNDLIKLNLTGNLTNQTADIAVFSMSSGKQVSAVSVDVTDYELSIDVADLPSGMYTVLVNIGSQVFNKKIVKN